ncbi:MAG: RNA 2',3'-cyclic phosphodiesterase [Candidatus Nealsonbacteria bacterium]|nr:RNA 2',3'-cyclic phosphodiesterase [Candidatus Nealsonbacteria bacterium]
MKRRIFVAINLPENIKKELSAYQEKWHELPARWTKKDNLHITLEFLGYLSDDEVWETCQRVRELASKYKQFSVILNKICYGPLNKMPPKKMSSLRSFSRSSQNGTPRMVWVVGKKIKELDLLPHITLARIMSFGWKEIEPEERLEINKEISLEFEVSSIDVMESVLKRGGPEYTILESCPLTPLEVL